MATEVEPEVQRTVPAWRRMLVAAGWFALALIAVGAVFYALNRHRMAGEMDRLTKDLDESDPGWRWPTALADRPEVLPERNSVPVILAVVGALPRGWPDSKRWESLEELPPNAALDPPRRQALDELLTAPPVPALRARGRDLVRFPRGRIDVTLSDVPHGTLLPNHQKVREAANLLRLDALDLALAGRHGEALTACRACLYVSRAFDDDRFLIGQLVRVAILTVALNAAERALALGVAPDDALAALQKDLEHEAGRTGLTAAMRGERASAQQMIALMASGRLPASELDRMLRWDGPPREWWMHFGLVSAAAARELSGREHADVLRLLTKMVEASKLPTKEQIAAEDEILKLAKDPTRGPVWRLLVPNTQKITAAARRGQCLAAAMRAALAAERHRLKHGSFPARLDDAVPAFIDRVPLDPIDEKPIRYKLTPDGAVAYSVGNDRRDDGGEVTRPQNDFGFRLWSPDRRRAAPPPTP